MQHVYKHRIGLLHLGCKKLSWEPESVTELPLVDASFFLETVTGNGIIPKLSPSCYFQLSLKVLPEVFSAYVCLYGCFPLCWGWLRYCVHMTFINFL